MTSQLFHSIKDAAQLVGVSPATLRLWEKGGLIRPQRNASGHRIYNQDDVLLLQRIQYLRRDQKLNIAAIRRELLFETRNSTGLRNMAESEDSNGSTDSADPVQEPAAENQIDLGKKLRVLRLQHGLTLEQAARQSGLSVSFISAVERGSAGISLTSLLKLTLAYNVLLQDLYKETTPGKTKLVKAADRLVFEPSNAGVRIEQLTYGPARMEAQYFLLEPGASSEGAYSHKGEELIYVLEGSIDFFLDEDEYYHAEAGDCIYFSSHQFHRWENSAGGQTRLLWVNTTPIIYPSPG
ncbi:MAG: MerR family transcriptional regulator [Anaerolineales bacterium]|nr:MerR family transcriptional regulator [Anaerolineales bacterium]